MADDDGGMSISGFSNLRLTIFLPSGIIFTMAISIIRSVPGLTPVVSRSMTASGRVSFSMQTEILIKFLGTQMFGLCCYFNKDSDKCNYILIIKIKSNSLGAS